MLISIIAAISRNNVIGVNHQLPWHLPADLRHFKQLTLNKPIIMGRATFASIGKPLQGRRNIVLTRADDYHAEGCLVVHSLDQALVSAADADEVMIIGGANLYQQALLLAHRFYLTQIDADFEGDSYFPAWDRKEWIEISREDHCADATNPYPFSFIVLHRRA